MRFAATNLNNFMDPMNFGAIGKATIMGQGLEERADIQGKAFVDRAEIKGDEIIGVAQAGVPVIAADASAESQASVMNGITSGIKGLAGGISKMPGIGGGGGEGVVDMTGLNSGLDVGYGELSNPSYLNLSLKNLGSY